MEEKRRRLLYAARAEYIAGGKTKNISEAFQWYIEAHREECAGVPLTITSREADRPKTFLDDYERPKCRKCGSPLFWKGACRACRGTGQKKNQWICKNMRVQAPDERHAAGSDSKNWKPKKENIKYQWKLGHQLQRQ